MGSPKQGFSDEGLLQSLTWPEEDRSRFTTAHWTGGYRWFKSPIIVCLEKYPRGPSRPPDSPGVVIAFNPRRHGR